MTPRIQGFLGGLLAGMVLAGMILAGIVLAGVMASHGSEAAAQANPKYSTKIVLENERVRVRDVTFPAGVLDTGMHTHDLAHVGVILTKGSLRFTEPGGQAETVAFEAGSVGFREPKATHQVANPGSGPMRVIEVEIK